MNAFQLKEVLEDYSDEELKTLDVRVFANMDVSEGDTIRVHSVEVTQFEELVIEI